MLHKHFFVTGTDTGVGKTVLSLLLMRALLAAGRQPFYCKPVQTGCATVHDADSDARFIYRYCPPHEQSDIASSVCQLYAAPKAPLFAARDAGTEVDTQALHRRLHSIGSAHANVVFEGAGGALVPVTRTVSMADIMAKLTADLAGTARTRVLVAARTGLGTINHTLLTLEALRHRNLDIAGVVMLQSPHSETPADMVAENIEAVEHSGVPVLCQVPVLHNFTAGEHTAGHTAGQADGQADGQAAVQTLAERLELVCPS